jgi:hypothetical protein
MAAQQLELHHQAPRCLLRLHEKAYGAELDGAGIEAWLCWEEEAMRWRVPVEISRSDLAALVEASTVALSVEEHRQLHSEASDFARWGRRGGLRTLERYGKAWFVLLGRRRHGRVTKAELRRALAVLGNLR